MKNKKEKHKFRFEGRVKLNIPFPIILECEVDNFSFSGFWTMKANELEIEVYEKNFCKMLKSFEEEIGFVWEEYGLADDKDLSPGAIKLKRKVIEIFGDLYKE